MPDPLSSDIVATLKSAAALAAALILAGSFPDLVSWAVRVLGGKDCAKANEPKANGVGHDQPRKANGASGTSGHAAKRFQVGPRAKGSHNPREAAARHDEALLALMRANPDANVTALIRLSGRPRNSATLSLERLQKAGLVEHAGRGRWMAVDPDLLEAPTPKPAGWLEPLSGARVAKHTAGGRVPDELTLAARG